MNQVKHRDGQEANGAASDLEARIVVLEIVSMTALAMALDTSDDADPEHARGVSNLMMETIRHRCDEMGLGDNATLSACSYADGLLSTALRSLYPNGH